jgi:hypothetical protein
MMKGVRTHSNEVQAINVLTFVTDVSKKEKNLFSNKRQRGENYMNSAEKDLLFCVYLKLWNSSNISY